MAIKSNLRRIPSHTSVHLAVWCASGIAALAAVFYARLIAAMQAFYFSLFHAHPILLTVATPGLFVLATWLVKVLAPEASGSGIPQVLKAIELSKADCQGEAIWKNPLVSTKTAAIKVVSSVVGILAGASIGREGPTVQIAATSFAWIGHHTRKFIPKIDFHSFLIAGGAAGVAAAFNTPLAGITFALEEIAEGIFAPFRQIVMLAVIIAGVTAQALQGDYLYFGHPSFGRPSFSLVPEALLVGTVAGLFGGAFAKLLAYPRVTRLPKLWWARSFLCGVVCAAIGFYTGGATAGSGYEITRTGLEATGVQDTLLAFPALKLITTVLSYLSGMAGGIFSPSLSIGAGVGLSVAKLAKFANFKACALLGMVAFFSAAVQAPLTAVVIVMEMTDQHILILPFMIAAFLAQSIGKRFMPKPLYAYLASRMDN